MMTITNILAAVSAYPTEYITVTGGEPLAQGHCHQLLTALCDRYSQVSLETSGARAMAHTNEEQRHMSID